MRTSKRQDGFTLIELLIVVAIIGIIASILIPNFLGRWRRRDKGGLWYVRNLGFAMLPAP